MRDQEPKYLFEGGRVINKASGEAIPLDEPVFILRARDVHAVHILDAYLKACAGGPIQHIRAISARVADFIEFARHHPERMKQPDTEFDG